MFRILMFLYWTPANLQSFLFKDLWLKLACYVHIRIYFIEFIIYRRSWNNIIISGRDQLTLSSYGQQILVNKRFQYWFISWWTHILAFYLCCCYPTLVTKICNSLTMNFIVIGNFTQTSFLPYNLKKGFHFGLIWQHVHQYKYYPWYRLLTSLQTLNTQVTITTSIFKHINQPV